MADGRTEADDALASAENCLGRCARRRCASGRARQRPRTVRARGPNRADRSQERAIRDADAVRQKFVDPGPIPDFLALVGDLRGRLPRHRRYRTVSAARLLNRHGPIESFPAGVLGDRARAVVQDLATLRTDAHLFADVDELEGPGRPAHLMRGQNVCRRQVSKTASRPHKNPPVSVEIPRVTTPRSAHINTVVEPEVCVKQASIEPPRSRSPATRRHHQRSSSRPSLRLTTHHSSGTAQAIQWTRLYAIRSPMWRLSDRARRRILQAAASCDLKAARAAAGRSAQRRRLHRQFAPLRC